MTKPKKTTIQSLPKSIRQCVRTILKAADKNDGVNRTGVVYFTSDGIGVVVSSSEKFHELLKRAANDLSDLHNVYGLGFQDGQDSVFHPNPAR